MITFLTKDDTSFTDQGILCQGQYYSGHLGVTKLCRFGEPTLFETISKRVGATEAKAILKKSSERGNRIHLEMETKWKEVLKEPDLTRLGKMAGVEVFLTGTIKSVKCLGFADAIFYNSDRGVYTIVDYKTKSSKYSWNTYGTIEKYWMQLSAYAILLNQMFGFKNIEVATFILFKDNSPYLSYYSTMEDLRPFAIKVLEKADLVLKG